MAPDKALFSFKKYQYFSYFCKKTCCGYSLEVPWQLMSTHNICFHAEIRKIICGYLLLSGAMLTHRYRFDGKLFNLRRLQAKSEVQTEVLDEFLFADDMAKRAPTEEKMQKSVDQVSDSCDSYDLTISIKKTEVVYQPAPGKPYKEPTITVKGQRLQVVDKFTYLGRTLSRVVHINDEVNARIAKASAAFGWLCGSIWDRSGIRRHKAESI